ncbi:hypothetical protein [Aurantimonas coralicida]|uniref:hypothetical protein n=1 Tax=Aurantimonas coralicida TaxID=182270 RepID=UPI001D1950AF|nr:hypothetical protein [Aurantimonas coralicida]MCC4296623.1 hypothetical protein [Aurantimonas coralicida]
MAKAEFMAIVADRTTGDFAVKGPMWDDTALTARVAKANEAGRNLVLSTPAISEASAKAEAARMYKGKLVALSTLLPMEDLP